MLATNPSPQRTVKAATPGTLSVPVERWRMRVRGLRASRCRSASRLNAIAALRAKTMAKRIPASSRPRKAVGGSLCAFAHQAITAAKSAKGKANSVWLKWIISSNRRMRRRPFLGSVNTTMVNRS